MNSKLPGGAAIAVLATGVMYIGMPYALADQGRHWRVLEWDEFEVFVEIDGTDEDAGFKVLLGGDPWSEARIFSPRGRQIYRLTARLGDVGSDTVFLEGAEPPFEKLPLDEFLDRFPEGTYTAWGRTLDGQWLMGTTELTYDLPDGPLITSHRDDQVVELTSENVVVTWDEVQTDIRGGRLGSAVVGYVLTVTYETADPDEPLLRELTIDLIPPDRFSAQIPADFFSPDTNVQIEIAVREESGNQTSKEIFIDVVDNVPDR